MHLSLYSLPLTVVALAGALSGWLWLFDGAGAAGEVAVLVYPPGWSSAQAFAAAGALNAPILGVGPSGTVIFILPQEAVSWSSARATGALAVLNSAFAQLCGADPDFILAGRS